MATQEKELYPIDQNLYRFNIMYQLRQIESNTDLRHQKNEQQVLKTLLKSCIDVNGNKLRLIMDSIFSQSLQSIPSKPTVVLDRVSNTKSSSESTALASEATTPSSDAMILTSETSNKSIGKDIAQDGDTSKNHSQNIDGTQNEAYASIIERQLFDPKMSKVSVKIKLHRKRKPIAAPPHEAVHDKERSSSMECSAYPNIQLKRQKTNKRSYQ